MEPIVTKEMDVSGNMWQTTIQELKPTKEDVPKPFKKACLDWFNPIGWDPKWWKTFTSLLLLIVWYAVLGGISSGLHTQLPTPQPASVTLSGGFSGENAWNHLTKGIATGKPRPINSEQVRVVHDYLNTAIQNIQAQYWIPKGRNFTHQAQDTSEAATWATVKSAGKNYTEFVRGNNVYVFVPGKGPEHETAIMLLCHYDSVWTSPGGTDDGAACAIMLSMLESLAAIPPLAHDLVFVWNCGEETGLWGTTSAFAEPWAKKVKVVQNYEGSGTGGKAMLFRSEVNQLSWDYAQGAVTPHANAVANLVFASGVVSSYTDYDFTYGRLGIASQDYAYYASRYLYHTPGDDIAHISAGSLQQFGDSALGALKVMGNDMTLASPEYYPPKPKTVKEPLPAYYDVLQQSMLFWTSTGYIIANTVLIAIVSLFVLGRGLWLKKHAVDTVERMRPILLSFGYLVASIFSGLVLGIVINLIPAACNQDFVYRYPYLAFTISAAAQLVMYGIFARVSTLRWNRIRWSSHWQPDSRTASIFNPQSDPPTNGTFWDGYRGTANPSEDGFWAKGHTLEDLNQVYDWHPRGDVAFREAFHSMNLWWCVCLFFAWVLSWFALPVLYWIFWFELMQCIASFLYMLADEWLRPKIEHYNDTPPNVVADGLNGYKLAYPMEQASNNGLNGNGLSVINGVNGNGVNGVNGNDINGVNGNGINGAYGSNVDATGTMVGLQPGGITVVQASKVIIPSATTTPRPSKLSSWLWAICWMIAVSWPFVVYSDFVQAIIDTFAPMTIEGIGAIAEVALISIIAAPYIVLTWPLIVRTGRGGFVAGIAGLILLCTAIAACVVPPFSPDRPYKAKLVQVYRPQEGISEIEIRSYTPIDTKYFYNALPASLKNNFASSKIEAAQLAALPKLLRRDDHEQELKRLQKRDFNPSSSSSWFVAGVPPPTIDWTWNVSSSYDATKGERTVLIGVSSPESNTCSVDVPVFPPGTNTSDNTFLAWPIGAPNVPISNAGDAWRIAHIRQSGTDFVWTAKYKSNGQEKSLLARVTCYAATWEKMPGMVQVNSQLPSWALVPGDGWYIAGVQRDIVV